MIGGIFLSTKVGGFTKNGVVQCVKLVEESATSKIDEFSGTYTSSSSNYTMTMKNGNTVEFQYNSSGNRNFMINIGSFYLRETTNNIMIFMSDAPNYAFSCEVTDTTVWSKSSNVYLAGAYVNFKSSASSGEYRIIMKDSSGTIIGNWYGTLSSSGYSLSMVNSKSLTLTYEDRFDTPTVRMYKDGTLKCKELIEETAVEDSSRLSMSQKTDALTLPYFNYDIRFINPGGQSLTIPSSYSELGYVTLLDSSGTQLNFSRSYSGGNNWTSSKNPSWTSGTVSIVRFTVSGTIKGSASQIAFVDNGTKQTQSARIIYFTKGSDGYYSNTSTPVTFNYDWLLKTPTVRVYKDGTIRCAEVQEATLRSKLNEFSGSSTLPPSSGVVTCTNGLKISIGAYSFPGSSGDAYTFVFRDENYRDFLKIIGKGASTTITSALDTSNASIWNQLSDITISEIKLDYLSTTTMPSSLVITWKGKSYTYSLYPSSTNPYSKLYRPSSSQVVLSVLDRVSFTWTS